MILDELPPCLHTHIFLRLPMKCVGRSRCVSKALCVSLNDPVFIRMHLDQSKRIANDHTLNLAVRKCSNLYSMPLRACTEKLRRLLSHYPNTFLEVVDLFHPSKGTGRPDILIGACDGILCVKSLSRRTIFLWNPFTRECKSAPTSFLEIQAPYAWSHRVALGFGYNPATADYVVVKIDSSSSYSSTVDIYSVVENSHRRIGQTHYEISVGSAYGELVNGALHWIASHRITQQKDLVVAFDIGSERLREVAQPDYVDKGFQKLEVAEITGQLSICVYYPDCVMTWVMRDYGVKESWINLFKIARNPIITRRCKPLYCYGQTGWFLLLHDEKLALFNPKYRTTLNRLEITGADHVDDIRFYTESMVKLNRVIYTDNKLVASDEVSNEPGESMASGETGKANGGKSKKPRLKS